MSANIMAIIIISHLFLFQLMFFIKNIVLSKKLKVSVRGKNKEATIAIILFTVTIIIAIISVLSEYLNELFIPIPVLANDYLISIGMFLLFLNLIISFLALVQMRDSWRVGIKEDKTDLIISGVFKITRNPYFLSYIILFLAYMILVANVLIIIFSLLAFISIHKMIIREEKYLEALHGIKYLDYKNNVPRYFLI